MTQYLYAIRYFNENNRYTVFCRIDGPKFTFCRSELLLYRLLDRTRSSTTACGNDVELLATTNYRSTPSTAQSKTTTVSSPIFRARDQAGNPSYRIGDFLDLLSSIGFIRYDNAAQNLTDGIFLTHSPLLPQRRIHSIFLARELSCTSILSSPLPRSYQRLRG